MFASMSRQGSRFASWKTRPIWRLGPRTGRSSSRTSPAVSRCSPDMDHNRVVLPQPDGPTIDMISPALMSSEHLVDGEQIAGTCVVDLSGVDDSELRA